MITATHCPNCKTHCKCPSCLKLFEFEHNLWYHIYGYFGPEVPPNCVGMATEKCHICKESESSCLKMVQHVEMKHNRKASVIRRVDGEYHHNVTLVDEDKMPNFKNRLKSCVK